MSKILYDWSHVFPIVSQLHRAGIVSNPDNLVKNILSANARYFFGHSLMFRHSSESPSLCNWDSRDLRDFRKIYCGSSIEPQSLYDCMIEIAENCGFQLGLSYPHGLRYQWLKAAAEWQLRQPQLDEEIVLISSVTIKVSGEEACFHVDHSDPASRALNRISCSLQSKKFEKLLECAFKLERILDSRIFLKFFQLLQLKEQIKLAIA